jgi:glycosyltransferase involved in cell wall biosynthesis
VKILFVCHDFPPFKLAGAQLFALKTAQALLARGHDVRVFYPVNASARTDGDLTPVYQIRATAYEQLPVYQLIVNDSETRLTRHPQYAYAHPQVEAAFRALLIAEHFDVVHFHLLYRLSARLPIIAKALGLTTVATLHDYWLLCAMGHMLDSQGRECSGPETPEKCAACLNGFREPPTPAVVSFFTSRIATTRAGYEAIDFKFSPSAFLADCHAAYGFTTPDVLPLGWIPVKPADRAATRGKRVIFGYLGQIISRKGLDLLLDAAAQLPHRNWELRVYGEAYQPEYFAPLKAVMKAHQQIRYCGPYRPDDLDRLYAEIDVAVIPSRRENYPLTVLEALSAGVPVIAAAVGGVREIVQDGVDGIVVPPHSAAAIRAAMARCLDDAALVPGLRSTIRPVKTIRENAADYERVYARRAVALSR